MIPHAAIRSATARFKPCLLQFGDRRRPPGPSAGASQTRSTLTAQTKAVAYYECIHRRPSDYPFSRGGDPPGTLVVVTDERSASADPWLPARRRGDARLRGRRRRRHPRRVPDRAHRRDHGPAVRPVRPGRRGVLRAVGLPAVARPRRRGARSAAASRRRGTTCGRASSASCPATWLRSW